MTHGFAQVIFGVPQQAEAEDTPAVKVLARSEGITLQSAQLWREATSLTPLDDSPAVGIFQLDSTYHILAYAHRPAAPRYTYTRIPREDLQQRAGHLDDLLALGPPRQTENGTLPPMPAPATRSWLPEQSAAALAGLVDRLGSLEAALTLLHATISRQRLLVYNPPPLTDRLAVVRGLMALLPACTRADLTFSTQVAGQFPALVGRVVFGDHQEQSNRFQYDWQAHAFDAPPATENRPAYVRLLASDDIDTVNDLVDDLDPVARCNKATDLPSRLKNITARYQLHQKVTADSPSETTPEDLKAGLSDGGNIPPSWRSRYAALLLPYALDAKDTEAHSMIAAAMDADPALDDTLTTRLYDMLPETPDLVYVFMRQRLSEGSNTRWQARLHDAATQSLDIALESSDPDLVLSWLRLLAREPNTFQLGEIVQRGVYKALPLAYQDSAFALQLLVLSARFISEVVDDLLNDETLLAALPADVRDAFAYYERDALADLQTHSSSLFLVGMGRAAEARAGAAFETGVLERIWALYQGERKINTRPPYTPDAILQTCAKTGGDWLPSSAIETLLGLLISNRDPHLYQTLTSHLHEQDMLAGLLPGALARLRSDENNVMDVVSQLASNEKLTPSQMLKIYITMLETMGWGEDTAALIQAVGRLLAQNPALTPAVATQESLLEAAAQLQLEPAARTAALSLLEEAREADDEILVERLQYIFSQLAWSTTARTAALVWWRTFAQEQPNARLPRLESALKGVRVLEDAQETLRSVSAMRRLLGKHDVESFVEAINAAYEVLGTLAEAFEPDEKGDNISFEPETVRATLVHMVDELSPHQNQILSNSLKGLAGLIAQMGDNRTKSGLGLTRRSDSIDRQLQSGEQMPQGAVDAMKWMAGFFGGAQRDEDKP